QVTAGHGRIVFADLVVDGVVLSDRIEDIRQNQLVPGQLSEKARLSRLAQTAVGVVVQGQDGRLREGPFLAIVFERVLQRGDELVEQRRPSRAGRQRLL